jgi:hypothetical protein
MYASVYNQVHISWLISMATCMTIELYSVFPTHTLNSCIALGKSELESEYWLIYIGGES